MTPKEFQGLYPNLMETILIIASDNGMPMGQNFDIPLFLKPSLNIFEAQAAQLSEDEKEILASGDDDERQSVVQRTGFDSLDDFLSEVFEGILSDIFWPPAKGN